MIESMNGGAFLSLMGDLAYKALDKLSNSSQVWDFTSCRDKSARIPKKRGIYELKGETEMNIKIDALTKRLNAPLHWYFPSTRWNKRTLSMITESSQLDLTLRCIIQDGGTIQTFHGSKIREEHLIMQRPNTLLDFKHSGTISLLLKWLHLHLNQL
jgi:hypothetical protein